MSATQRRLTFAARVWAWCMRTQRSRLLLARVLVRQMHNSATYHTPPDDIQIRQATAEDLRAALPQWPANALTAEFIEMALKRGDLCIAAFDPKSQPPQMVAFVWRSFNQIPHKDGVYIEVKAPYWYTYKMTTHPDYKGKGLGGLLTLFGDRLCADTGRYSGVGFVESHNYSSLRANTKVGSRSVGWAGYLKVFGRTRTFRTPGVVPHTFRFISAPGPEHPEFEDSRQQDG